MKKDWKITEKRYFTKSVGAGAKCDHLKLEVGTRSSISYRPTDLSLLK